MDGCCSSSLISSEDQKNTGYFSMFGALFWLLSLACDTVEHTLNFDFFCPFVVIDPSDLNATRALCLTIFDLPNTEYLNFTDVIGLVCLFVCS